jgi:hypothetical protein
VSARVSLNELGRYLVASPRKRHSIVRNQKERKPYIVARYREARRAMREYWASGGNGEIITKAISDLMAALATPGLTEWQAEDYALSIEALEGFLEFDHPDFTGATFFDDKNDHLQIAGVDVSIAPDARVRFSGNDGSATFGLVKLCISKTQELSEKEGLYIATLLHRAAERYGTALYDSCSVVDVFSGSVFTTPRARRARMQDIEAACREFALLWNSF